MRLLTNQKCLVMLMKWSFGIKNFFTYLNNKCDGCLTLSCTAVYIDGCVSYFYMCNEDKLTNSVPLEKPCFASPAYTY